jgi:hypothetical protein
MFAVFDVWLRWLLQPCGGPGFLPLIVNMGIIATANAQEGEEYWTRLIDGLMAV